MNSIKVNIKDKIAVLSLDRGRSNAINSEMVSELHQMIRNIENDDTIAGLILTGKDGFFSAGLDLIELYDYDEDQIENTIEDFVDSEIENFPRYMKNMGFEDDKILDFIDMDDLFTYVINSDGYGNILNHYDGRDDEYLVNNKWYHVMRED